VKTEEIRPEPGGIRAAAEGELPTGAFSDVGMKQLNERDWLAGIRRTVAERWKVNPQEVILSPTRSLAAFAYDAAAVRSQGKRPSRRYSIIVTDTLGRRQHLFRAVPAPRKEAPKDLRFMGEDRLLYEVVLPAPKPARGARAKVVKGKQGAPKQKKAARPARAPAPERLLVVQPLKLRARPVRCKGTRFATNATRDRLAFVAGKPGAETVWVEGVRVWPRKRGRADVPSDLAWSRDAPALAFLELRPDGVPRLVLIADVDNPTGDTTWDLPAAAAGSGQHVFWAGSDRLVVGRTMTRPLFSTTFSVERPP
jgi:hypothetical protein